MSATTEKTTEEPTTDQPTAEQVDEQEGNPQEWTNADGVKFRIIHEEDAGPESEGQVPKLIEGQRVQIVSGPGTKDGTVHRMAYITDVYYEDTKEHLIASNADHPGRRFAKVTAYDVRTRDARSEVLHVKPEDIRTLETEAGWGRGQI